MDVTLTPNAMLSRLAGALTLAIRIADRDPALVDDCAATQQEIQRVIRDACLKLGEVPLLQAKINALRLALVGLFEALGATHVRGWMTVALTEDVVETSMSGTNLVNAMNDLVARIRRNVYDRELAYVYYLCLVFGFSGDYARTDYANDQPNRRETLTTFRQALVACKWLSAGSELAAVVTHDTGAAAPGPRAPWPLFLALSAAVVTLVTFVLIRHSQANTLRELQQTVDGSPLTKTGASPRTRR